MTLNGQPVSQVEDGTYSYVEFGQFLTTIKFKEKLGDHEYLIAIPQFPSFIRVRNIPVRRCRPAAMMAAPSPARCLPVTTSRWVITATTVWTGAIGDSSPTAHLRGKAFFIWFNWDDISSFLLSSACFAAYNNL